MTRRTFLAFRSRKSYCTNTISTLLDFLCLWKALWFPEFQEERRLTLAYDIHLMRIAFIRPISIHTVPS
jgi:hypothetical protein